MGWWKKKRPSVWRISRQVLESDFKEEPLGQLCWERDIWEKTRRRQEFIMETREWTTPQRYNSQHKSIKQRPAGVNGDTQTAGNSGLESRLKKKFRLNKYSYRSSATLVIREMQIKTTVWDFTDGPGAKTPSFQCRGPGFDPWSYFRSCMQLRSLHTTMKILQVETQT